MDSRISKTDRVDISHSFEPPAAGSSGIFAGGVCSQTLHKRLLCKINYTRRWMFECYSEFAGDIYFLNPGANRKGRREKNSIHLYGPGCRFREDTRKAELPLRETFINFTGGEICGLDNLTDSKSKYCRFLDPRGTVMELMLEAAQACAQHGDQAFWDVQSFLMRCIGNFLNFSIKLSPDTYEIKSMGISPGEKLIRESEEFMRRNITSSIKNSDIAEFMKMSESSFNHGFKKASGITPNARLLEIKIDTAKNLLLKGLKIKIIAEAAGFKNEFYFSRMFKKITGVSPSDFRSGKGGTAQPPG